MIDAHNHLQDHRFNGRQAELIVTMKDQGITGCIANGTCESDWPEVARLAEEFPDFVFPAFGLHPWQVEQRSPNWLATLDSYLDRFPQSSIGECGLDRWMESPDLKAQHEVFRAQLNLGLTRQRPVTIHCLKAWGPLLEELREAPALPKFLLHSFAGSPEVARECLKLGAYFSFSGYFLHPRKAKVRETFQSLPIEKILVETDAPDMAPPEPQFEWESGNHPANLSLISRQLGELMEVDPRVFAHNARMFFFSESHNPPPQSA